MRIIIMKLLNCCCQKRKRRDIVLLLVGLDNAGKTTAAKGLAKQNTVNVLPTAGFSTIKLRHKGYNVIIYDLGGGPQIRDIWPKYFCDIHGVIFIIDASDMDRIAECRRELKRLVLNEKISKKPLLVLANKQDKPDTLDEIDIIEKLALEPLINAQKCPTRVEMCSFLKKNSGNGKMDPGLLSGYRWLLGVIIKQYKELNERVLSDSLTEKNTREQTREAWRKRKGLLQNCTSDNSVFPMRSSNDNGCVENNSNISSMLNNPVSITSKDETSSLETVIHNGTVEVITHNHNSFRNPFIIHTPEFEISPSTSDQKSDQSFNESSGSTTLLVREQLERKSIVQRQKSFSAHAGRRKKLLLSPTIKEPVNTDSSQSSGFAIRTINVRPSGSDEPSPVLLRAASPYMELPPVRPPGTSRPMTTRSLGRSGRAWDLDLPLEVSADPPETKDKSTNIF